MAVTPPHSSSSGSGHLGVRSSANYTWHTRDLLGQGASGSVYKAINKSTRMMVAVKCFNDAGSMTRSQTLSSREVTVMNSVKHENIVKLLGTEEDMHSHKLVLVMELCNGGSLLNVLEEPRNNTGMHEEDFRVVMSHTTAGMKYLRKEGYVHRDVKPGNILRHIAENGKAIYKITDFGAARELEEDEVFHSVYGTYEYLHPDVFGQGVMHRGGDRNFKSVVDLWSLGVTLYQCACGKLPFRLNSGSRTDLRALYNAVSRKPENAIAGIQSSSGQIDYKNDLPKENKLSVSFRKSLVKILRGMLQCDAEKASTFDTFFAEAEGLLAKKVVHVFHVNSSQLHEVLIDPSGSARDALKSLREDCEIPLDQPRLWWIPPLGGDVCNFTLMGHQQLKAPATTVMKPAVLECGAWQDSQKLEALKSFAASIFNDTPSIESDHRTAQTLVNWGHYVLRSIKVYKDNINCLNHSASVLGAVIHKEYRQTSESYRSHQSSWELLKQTWASVSSFYNMNLESVQQMTEVLEFGEMTSTREFKLLKLQASSLREEHSKVATTCSSCAKYHSRLRPPSEIISWDAAVHLTFMNDSEREMKVMLEALLSLCRRFGADKKNKRSAVLSMHDEVVHRSERDRLMRIAKEIQELNAQCLATRGTVYDELKTQWSKYTTYKRNLRDLEANLGKAKKDIERQEGAVKAFSSKTQKCFGDVQDRCLPQLKALFVDGVKNQQLAVLSADGFTREKLEKLHELIKPLMDSYQQVKEEAATMETLAMKLRPE